MYNIYLYIKRLTPPYYNPPLQHEISRFHNFTISQFHLCGCSCFSLAFGWYLNSCVKMEEASSIEQLSKNACFLHGLLEVLQPLKSAPIMSKIGCIAPKRPQIM